MYEYDGRIPTVKLGRTPWTKHPGLAKLAIIKERSRRAAKEGEEASHAHVSSRFHCREGMCLGKSERKRDRHQSMNLGEEKSKANASLRDGATAKLDVATGWEGR